MGVFLNLAIVPDRISPKEWSEVYQESLILLEKFPFLDRVEAENGYCYAARSAHRENVLGGHAGWCIEGDMHSGATMESFFLVDDIAYYQEKTGGWAPNEQDILLHDLADDIKAEGPPFAWVWGAKTQGRPAHLYLLAIGCLLCHRFPNAALVSGDISAAQCRNAVTWANQYLEVPIDVPVTADVNRLLPRLMSSDLEEKHILPALYQLTLEARRSEMGDCLRESLPASVIERYYKEQLLPYERDPTRLYLNRFAVKEYLELGLDFKTLCQMVMVDPEGNQLKPLEFLKVLLEMKFHVPIHEKVLFDFVAFSRERGSAEVETVNRMLFSAFCAMHGARNRNVAAYMPLDEIIAMFETVAGAEDYRAMAEELLIEIYASVMYKNQNDLYDGPDSIYREMLERSKKIKKENEKAQRYDIASRDEVIDYRRGDTVEPTVHAGLVNYAEQLRKIGQNVYEDAVQELDEAGRKAFFHRNYRVLIPEEIEDRFFMRIMDRNYIVRYVSLYSIEVADDIRWAIRSFLWNPELLDHYWELTEQERAEENGRTDGE